MNTDLLKKEVYYKASRSSKPGGQHVNKVSSSVRLFFDLPQSKALNPYEKDVLLDKLQNRLTKDGILMIKVEVSRSQHFNKKAAWEQLLLLLEKSLKRPKKRLKTKPKKSAILKRLQSKKHHSLKKQNRRKDFL